MDGDTVTFGEILEAMEQHTIAYPDHGYNCGCKDQYLRRARAYFRAHPVQREQLLYVAQVMRHNP